MSLAVDKNIKDLLGSNPKLAVAKILDKYGNALLTVIIKIVGTREVAEDVLQDTAIKVWKNADSFDQNKGRLFTWLLNIARNTAIDKVRTKKFQYHQKSQSLEDFVYNDIDFSEEMKIEDVGLRQVVEHLDEKYQKIIDLLYFQGYTQKEVMEELGIPLGTVKSRARAALSKLRILLAQEKPKV